MKVVPSIMKGEKDTDSGYRTHAPRPVEINNINNIKMYN
jgi:hypothetical protein